MQMNGRHTGKPAEVELYRGWMGARWARVTEAGGKVVHLTERQARELYAGAWGKD